MDLPGPASTVDALRAQRDGTARLRRRRRTAIGATVVAVAAAATLSLTLPGSGGGRSLAPVGPATSSPASSSASSLPSPTWAGSPTGLPGTGTGAGTGTPVPTDSQTSAPYSGKAPISVEAEFGWLPDSVRTIRYQLTPYGVQVRAEGSWSDTAPLYFLTVFDAGVTPPLPDFPGGSHGVKLPAPPVNGQEAYWLSSDDPGYAAGLNTLRWKAADGRWLELQSSYVPAAERTQTPLRIAAGVTIAHRALPLPLRVDGIPPGFVVSSGSFDRPVGTGRGGWSVDLNLSSAPGRYFTTVVTPDGPEPTPTADLPSGPADGHAQPGPVCKTGAGLKVCVHLTQQDALDALGGPQAWLDRITPLGTDPAGWTTDVLG
ncbi:hypothetical protein ACIRBX_34485 [Kitasatospora sp. NPDC096147]|uniref:hypothetical protein n=1 Tax=Kitasatospora sp. NPDC096147 TaxID=3364093 RepID=UPI0038006D64